MSKNKKSNSKNRIKGFFMKSTKHGKNRIKGDEESSGIQKVNDGWEEDNQDSDNPEKEGDQS